MLTLPPRIVFPKLRQSDRARCRRMADKALTPENKLKWLERQRKCLMKLSWTKERDRQRRDPFRKGILVIGITY